MNTPIHNGLLQSPFDCAGFPIVNCPSIGGSGGGGGMPGVFVNVKDEPFNAKGDGTTDDTDAINYAMGYVVGLGGGTVFFPHGVYLVNGAFHTYWKSILVIPWVTNTTDSPIVLELLGENTSTWTVVGAAQDFTKMSTIATTRTDGMTAESNGFAAIIAGNQPRGNGVTSDYTTMNAVFVRIKRMTFYCPDNPTMGAIRLDGHGWASVDEVLVTCGGSEPTHGTTGIWMPNAINWSTSWLDKCNAQSFAFGYKLSEHTHAPWIQAWACKVGVGFLEAMYPSRVGLLFGNCPDAVKFLGYHTVDLYMEGEHAFGSAPPWQWALHEISDVGNKGMGIVRYHIGHGDNNSPPVTIALDGGTGLTVIDLVSGNITQNTTQGSAGGAARFTGNIFARNPLILGYTDTLLARQAAGVVEVTSLLRYPPIAFASLPTAGGGTLAVGQFACVGDAAAGLALGAVVSAGGGATKYLIWWNGTNWTVVGK